MATDFSRLKRSGFTRDIISHVSTSLFMTSLPTSRIPVFRIPTLLFPAIASPAHELEEARDVEPRPERADEHGQHQYVQGHMGIGSASGSPALLLLQQLLEAGVHVSKSVHELLLQ